MPVYLIAQINIHDRVRYSEYSDGFMEVFNQYTGKVLAVDENVETMEGNWDFSRTVLVEFPSQAEAKSWYNGDEYKKLVEHRFAASEANIVLIQGMEAETTS
jgi:uncharacterized protein (DUF1330 family)